MKKTLSISIMTLLLISCHLKKKSKEFVLTQDSLKVYFEKAIGFSPKEQVAFHNKVLTQFSNDSLALAKACEYIGDAYKKQTLFDSAYLYYSKAEKWYTILQDKGNIGKMIFYKATLQHHDGDFIRSELSCLQALGYFLDAPNQNKRELYDVYNLLGILANEQKGYDDAIVYYNKALQSITQDGSMVNYGLLKANVLNNLGVVYQEQDKDKQALSYFTRALKTQELLQKVPFLYAILLDNVAYSRLKLKDYGGVLDLFYKALHVRESLELVPGIVINKLHLSEYYQEKKQSQKALDLAQEAYNLAKIKGRDPRDVMLSLEQLQKVNPSNKGIYTLEYMQILDSIEKNQPHLHETVTQIIEQSEALALQKTKIEKQNKAILFWSSMSLVIAFLLFIIYAISKKLQLKNAYEKIYNLMIAQETKDRKMRYRDQCILAKELCDTMLSRLFGTRLLLENANEKNDFNAVTERKTYLYELKAIEHDIRKLCDKFLNKEKYDVNKNNFVRIIRKRVKEEQKHTTVTYYIAPHIMWSSIDIAVKIKLYQILDISLNTINTIPKITNIDIKIHTVENDILMICIKGSRTAVGANKTFEMQEVWSRIEQIDHIPVQWAVS